MTDWKRYDVNNSNQSDYAEHDENRNVADFKSLFSGQRDKRHIKETKSFTRLDEIEIIDIASDDEDHDYENSSADCSIFTDKYETSSVSQIRMCISRMTGQSLQIINNIIQYPFDHRRREATPKECKSKNMRENCCQSDVSANDLNSDKKRKSYGYVTSTPVSRRSQRIKMIRTPRKRARGKVITSPTKSVSYLRQVFSPHGEEKVNLSIPRIVIVKPSPVAPRNIKIRLESRKRFANVSTRATPDCCEKSGNVSQPTQKNLKIVNSEKSGQNSSVTKKLTPMKTSYKKKVISPVGAYIRGDIPPTKKYIPFQYLGKCRPKKEVLFT